MSATQPTRSQSEHDEVEHLIAWHDGDLRAAIHTLLEDRRHLRNELALATAAISVGLYPRLAATTGARRRGCPDLILGC